MKSRYLQQRMVHNSEMNSIIHNRIQKVGSAMFLGKIHKPNISVFTNICDEFLFSIFYIISQNSVSIALRMMKLFPEKRWLSSFPAHRKCTALMSFIWIWPDPKFFGAKFISMNIQEKRVFICKKSRRIWWAEKKFQKSYRYIDNL